MGDPQADLHRYLTMIREAVLWKLDGVSEYDARRPMTPTGTNLLGVVKHLACVHIGYFGWSFDRGRDIELPWYADDADPNADMWAAEDESREQILALYQQACELEDHTIADLPLDAPGHVPWWPADRNPVTLQLILLHVIAETNRHAGQLDILRELIDGAAGLRAENSNLPDGTDWPTHHARLESVAARFR
ncbi:MAG TPA: DinB family protein [Sporichthyaceae bacterium]|nr:DinB family protein [Sporichthyaceae bacterium]